MEFASARRASSQALSRSFRLSLALLILTGGSGCRKRPAPIPVAAPGEPALGVHLAGRVVDARQGPIPDARVLAFPLGGGEPGRATADVDGRFQLAGLAPGAYRVLVEATGFPAAERAPVAAPADGLVVALTGEGRSIRGRVTRAGAPASATVTLGDEAGGPLRQTESRADGRFAFAGLGDGTYALRATRGDAVSATVRGVTAAGDGTALAAALELEPGSSISGRVVEDAGVALARIEVRAEASALAPGDDPLPAFARSDAGGAFTLGPLRPGSYRLTAARAGFVLRRAPSVDVPVAAGAAPVVIELLRGARVLGRVTDAHGAPAAAARVRCVASGIEDLTVQTGPLPLAAEAAALPSGAGRALGSTRTVLADARGRFTVDDLIPGRYHVEIAYPGAEPLRTDELTLAPGERRDLGTLALREGVAVTGQVRDDNDIPIEGARIVMTGPTADGLTMVTDGAGTFSLAVAAGHYRVAATAAGHGAAQADVDVASGSAPAPLALRLPRAEAMLEGLVRDTGGRPLGRARLLAWPAGAAPPDARATPLGSTTADVGGHFRIADLPAGDLRVEVDHPDYPRTTLSATPGQFASLTVPFPGAISGEARVRATGAAVARGRVEAAGPDGARAIAELQRAGVFRLPRLVPGHWRLTVSAPGFQPGVQELDVPPSESLGEPSVRDLRVELDPS